MKKTKYLAIATTLGVLSTSFVGCGVIDNPEETEQLAASVSELENYNLDILYNIKSSQTAAELKDLDEYSYAVRTKERVSGNNVALTSIDADYTKKDETMSVSFGETYILANDTLYLNMQSLLSTYSEVIKNLYTTFDEEASFDLDLSSLSDVTWVEIPLVMKGTDVEKNTADITTSLSDLMETIIKKSDILTVDVENGYTLEIKDKETAINVIETIKSEMESNKDLYITQIDTAINTMKDIDYIGFYENIYLDAFKGVCDYAGVTYTDDDIQEIRNQINEDIGEVSEELESEIGSIGSAYDEYLDELDEMITELKENEEVELSFSYTNTNSGSKGSQVFEQVFKFNAKNDEATSDVTITYKASETNETVTAPTDAHSIQSIVTKFMDFLIDNDLIDEDIFDDVKGKNILEVMQSTPVEEPDLGDYDIDWDNDDNWSVDEDFNWGNDLVIGGFDDTDFSQDEQSNINENEDSEFVIDPSMRRSESM